MVVNYCNQWVSVLRFNVYNMYFFFYDQCIFVGCYDYFGIGGIFWGDEVGEVNFFILMGKFFVFYSKCMGGYCKQANYFVVGVEVGVVQCSIDFFQLCWGL